MTLGKEKEPLMPGLKSAAARPKEALDTLRSLSWNGVRLLVRTLARELAPKGPDIPLTLAKIRLATTALDDGIKVMPIAAVLLAICYSMWHPAWLVAIWVTLFGLTWSLHWTIGAQLAAAPRDNPSRALALILLKSALFVSAWGSQVWFFWVPGDPINHMIITAVALASTMGASMSAAWSPASAYQIVFHIGTTALAFLLEGGPSNVMMACLALVYAVFVAGTTIRMHGTTEQMLRLESDKDALIADLRAANKAKSEFLANMSHELRTPLNAILGFSEVIKDEIMGPIGTPGYKGYAGDIHQSGQHLLGLINDILDLSKIEAGRTELRDDLFTIDAISDAAIAMVDRQAQAGRITLLKDVDSSIVVRWDLRAAKQIAINLMSNAVKFTPPGGTVTVRSRRTADGGATVSVIDTGCGIAPEEHALVFEPFGQGRHDIAIEHKSTGLGLAIVRGLVEAHGGRLELESEPGRGAAFIIVVPPDRVQSRDDARLAA